MNKQETRACIGMELPTGMDKFSIRSDWLAGIINDMHAAGTYPYNADVERKAAAELDALTPDETKRLGTLVYNAQKYADELRLSQAGYVRATQALLATVEGKLKATSMMHGGCASA